ncbi:ribokinase [Enterococcus faecium]|uniref:ribokinase n=1 Tax=Enterococcus faecium TaxID=1352 RepID=UPI0022043C1C|nr:ribokinase [Enterococcus faecium]BDP99060.1 ribokinase [Enterococcus faecium]
MFYDVVVLGSINMDVRVETNNYPEYSETVFANKIEMLPGGKGSNQAVSVAKQGKKLAFLGAVGQDSAGKQMLQNLENKGILTSYILQTNKAGTGTFVAIVDNSGENTMVGTMGANETLLKEDIREVFSDIEAKVLLLQMETSRESIIETMKIAKEKNMYTILDPAPADGYFEEALKYASLVTPNQQETDKITGIKVVDEETAFEAAKKIHAMGVPDVIIKMGNKGSLVYKNGEKVLVDSIKVKAVDTVGAGDTFAGALAATLVDTDNLVEAVRFANIAAGIKVSRFGGQEAIPTKEEVMEYQKEAITQ